MINLANDPASLRMKHSLKANVFLSAQRNTVRKIWNLTTGRRTKDFATVCHWNRPKKNHNSGSFIPARRRNVIHKTRRYLLLHNIKMIKNDLLCREEITSFWSTFRDPDPVRMDNGSCWRTTFRSAKKIQGDVQLMVATSIGVPMPVSWWLQNVGKSGQKVRAIRMRDYIWGKTLVTSRFSAIVI